MFDKLQQNVKHAEDSIPKLIPVPHLYGTPIWRNFVFSLIKGVVQGRENSNGNKLVSCIRRELSLSSSEQKKKSENTQGELFREADKADLLDWLRSEWKNLKPTIVNYYVPSKNVFQTEDVQTGDDKEGLFSRKISNERDLTNYYWA